MRNVWHGGVKQRIIETILDQRNYASARMFGGTAGTENRDCYELRILNFVES